MISCIVKTKIKVFLVFLMALMVSSGAFAQGESEQMEVSQKGVVPGAAEGATAAASTGGLPVDDVAIVNAGNALFKNNCAVCHSAGTDVIVGPGLAGINQRRSHDWLIRWIKNSQALIQAGDPEAVAIYNEYNKQAMPSFNFTDEEITAILTYIASAEAGVEAVQTTVGSGTDQAPGANVGTDAIGAVGSYLDIILVVLILVLIVLVITLLLISSLLKNYLNTNRQLSERKRCLIIWCIQ